MSRLKTWTQQSSEGFHGAIFKLKGKAPSSSASPELFNVEEQRLFTKVLLSNHADIFHSDEEEFTNQKTGKSVKRRLILSWRSPHATLTLHTLDSLSTDTSRRDVLEGVQDSVPLPASRAAMLAENAYAPFVIRSVLDEWCPSTQVSAVHNVLLCSVCFFACRSFTPFCLFSPLWSSLSVLLPVCFPSLAFVLWLWFCVLSQSSTPPPSYTAQQPTTPGGTQPTRNTSTSTAGSDPSCPISL